MSLFTAQHGTRSTHKRKPTHDALGHTGDKRPLYEQLALAARAPIVQTPLLSIVLPNFERRREESTQPVQPAKGPPLGMASSTPPRSASEQGDDDERDEDDLHTAAALVFA